MAYVYMYLCVAGFRDRAELLESTFLRMGMLAVLRSRYVSKHLNVRRAVRIP